MFSRKQIWLQECFESYVVKKTSPIAFTVAPMKMGYGIGRSDRGTATRYLVIPGRRGCQSVMLEVQPMNLSNCQGGDRKGRRKRHLNQTDIGVCLLGSFVVVTTKCWKPVG